MRLPSGRLLNVGCWATELEAALAHDRAVLFYRGDVATLNFRGKALRAGPADARTLRAACERARKATTSSRYRGVTWASDCKCWRVGIAFKGNLIYLGLYSDERAAALAYDAKARELRGASARLNFPPPATKRAARM